MAIRTFRGTVNSNWNNSGNWLEGATPTGLDDVIFDALSPNCTQDTATGAATLTITTTGYNGTINLLYNLTVASTVILSSTTTLSGVGIFRMVISGTVTVSQNGATISCDVLFNGNATFTLGSNWTITGDVTCNGSSLIINGNTITCSSNISFTSGSCSGTTSFIINGTGTWGHSIGSVLSNNITINTTGTITLGSVIVKSFGTITYTAGTVVTTGNTLTIVGGTTLNTNGIIWNNITFTASATHTLTSDLTLSGTWSQNSGVVLIVNGFQVNVGSVITNSGAGSTLGTTNFLISGTTTVNLFGTLGFKNNLTINSSGTVTVAGLIYSVGTLTYTAGTVITTGNTLTIGASTTLNTNGITWNNITLITTQTLTLGSNLNLSGTFAILGTSQTFTVNGFTINTGGLATNVTSSILTGTTSLVFNGTGTHTGSASTSIRIPITINTSGTLTFALGSLLQGCILTYIAGTLVIPSTFTWYTNLSNTFNTPGVSWANFFLNGGSTVTINALLTAIKIEVNGGGISFIGTSGFNTGTFMFYQAGGSSNTITLKSGLTYNVTTAMSNTATAALTHGLVSSTPGTKAILTLSQGATQDLDFCNATDIDSSAGLTIWSYKGVLSNATNWNEMSTTPRAISYIN